MSIRHAPKRQSLLASQKRSDEVPRWCNGSNAILAMMAVVFAIISLVEILLG